MLLDSLTPRGREAAIQISCRIDVAEVLHIFSQLRPPSGVPLASSCLCVKYSYTERQLRFAKSAVVVVNADGDENRSQVAKQSVESPVNMERRRNSEQAGDARSGEVILES